MEPAGRFELPTSALRMPVMRISHNPQSLQSLKIPMKSRILRLRRTQETPDRGERAPRVPQRDI